MTGEDLIYCPNGTFTYTIPGTNVFPSTWKFYITNTITARLPEEKELTQRRNVAENIYDLDNAGSAYPHATVKSAYNNQLEFQERNAIDGCTANTGHGNYPYQSWGPRNDDGYQWMQVDFGHQVYVDEVEIFIRADFPHDTHYTSATLEFSDGSTKNIVLKRTAKGQKIKFDTVATSYVKIKDLVPADSSTSLWPGITEFKVYGCQQLTKEAALTTLPVEDNLIYGVNVGTTVSQLKATFTKDVVVKDNSVEVTEGTVKTGMTVTADDVTYTVVVTGDVTGDGRMTVSDVVKCRSLIGNSVTALEVKALDLSGNGSIDNADVTALKNKIME